MHLQIQTMCTSEKSNEESVPSSLKSVAQSQKIQSQSIAKPSKPAYVSFPSKDIHLSYNYRQDVKKNQISVHLFYVQILSLYIQKIYYYQRRRQLVTFFEQEDIERFNSAIRYFYNQSIDNYVKSLKRRQSNSTVNLKISEKSEAMSSIGDDISFKSKESPQKLENVDSPQQMSEFRFPSRQSTENSYRPSSQKSPMPTLFSPIFSNITIPQSLCGNSDSGRQHQGVSESASLIKKSQEDSQCKGSQTCQDHVKASENDEEEGEEQEQEQSENQSESSDMFEDYAQRAETKVNCLFFGNFSNNNIKRKPKEEKIYLELHNVFLKFADNGRDIFFDRASFELKKVEKSTTPIEDAEK